MRAVLAALAALFVAVGTASAAEPLIGGKLTAYSDHATVVSTATMPVEVTMAGSDVTVLPERFTLEPGQLANVAIAGPRAGTVSARLVAIGGPVAGDAATVTLQVTLKEPPPPPFPWGMVVLILAVSVILATVTRRLRPWRWRIVTVQ